MKANLTKGKLLDGKGHLIESGWSTKTVREYDRKDITASVWRIKEWDYYIVTNGKVALALTIADNGYMSLVSASFLDFTKPSFKTTSEMKFFTFGKIKFPPDTDKGDVNYCSKRVKMNFVNDGSQVHLTCKFDKFDGDKTLTADIVLTEKPSDSMVIATPFDENPKAFYYNAKINCQKAVGTFSVGDDKYQFNGEDSLGTLDWGRGVWTYKNTWYWGSMSTYVDGHKFGFNIGYGFGNRSTGTENMLFYDGIAHKLDQITFNIPKDDKGNDDFMSDWTFTSNDKRFEMNFTPIIDRKDVTDVGIIASHQHQVFGKFNGIAVLDDGTKIELKDQIGFAEKVFNKW